MEHSDKRIRLRCFFIATILLYIISPSYAVEIRSISGDAHAVVDSKSKTTRLETGRWGKASVAVKNSEDQVTEVYVAPGSEISFPSTNEIFSLATGRVRVIVRKILGSSSNSGKPRVQFRTATAVMGVRGTEFFVEANRDRTIVCTLKGLVEAGPANSSTTKLIGAGEGIVAWGDGTVTEPQPMDPRQRQWWRAQTEVAVASIASPDIWHWSGPTAVDSLDPYAFRSSYQALYFGGGLWTRALQSNDSLDNHERWANYRLHANVTWVPNKHYLLFAEGFLLAKSGHHNPFDTGAVFHQGFWLARTEGNESLAIGRQEWDFGSGLILGKDPWSPTPRHFDGAMATVRTPRTRVRLFGASLGDRVESIDLEDFLGGAYFDFSRVPVDAYLIGVRRNGDGDLARTQNLDDWNGTVGAGGVRMHFEFPSGFYVGQEFAYQAGRVTQAKNRRRLSAFVATAEAGFGKRIGGSLALRAGPNVLFASGDENPNDSVAHAFVPMFHNSNQFLGFVGVFPQIRNIQKLAFTFSAHGLVNNMPVTLIVEPMLLHRFNTDDTVYPVVNNFSEKRLGYEIDTQLGFEPVEQVFIQAGIGVFDAGPAYRADHPSLYRAFLMGQLRI